VRLVYQRRDPIRGRQVTGRDERRVEAIAALAPLLHLSLPAQFRKAAQTSTRDRQPFLDKRRQTTVLDLLGQNRFRLNRFALWDFDGVIARVTKEQIPTTTPIDNASGPSGPASTGDASETVIGHDAGGKRRDRRGLRIPGNGHQDQTCNRHRRESPYHCASPYVFACGIDIRFDLP
jgi:hypothetical protein